MSALDIDDVALLIPCSYCGAESGDWCVSRKSGAQATWLHEARRQPITEIRREGWQTGKEVGRRDAAAAMHRLLFAPVEKVGHTDVISLPWLLRRFYDIRKELVP